MSLENSESVTTTPKISIVMAAYNEELTISKAIDSICAQTFNDWELIIIDDGSTDSTADVVRRYIDKDSRIRFVRNKTNMKLPTSLNKGIRLAKADLIARADADDINLPERLAKQFAFMQAHPEVDVLGTGAYLLDATGKRINAVLLQQTHENFEKLPLIKTHFFHPSVMIRRRFFEVAGYYNTSFLRAEDKELWLRGLNLGCRYANLEEPLIEYSTNEYSRKWRSIMSRTLSLLHIVRIYRVKRGYTQVFLLFAYSAAIKMGIYKPKSIRSDRFPRK